MIDWNGNGKIDPVDIGVTIAAIEDANDDSEVVSEETAKKRRGQPRTGCLTEFVVVLLIPILLTLLAAINI